MPLTLHAQGIINSSNVQEEELRACLNAEVQAREQFKTLEVRANELRGSELLLRDLRSKLTSEKLSLDSNKPDKARVVTYNEQIRNFNARTDQFNADKEKHEQDQIAYENWMNANVKPICDRIKGRPIKPVTSYYACDFHTSASRMQQHPHCETLPQLQGLKACINKAGSRVKAEQSCNSRQ